MKYMSSKEKRELKKKNRIIFCMICLCIIIGIVIYLIINMIIGRNLKIDNSLIAGLDIQDNDIYMIKDSRIFKGKNPDNYIIYKGIEYRIIRINRDGSLEIVSNEKINMLKNKNDDVRKYLNDIYIDMIGYNDLIKNSYCEDIIKDNRIDKCSKINIDDYVRMPSIEDIVNSMDGDESYLLDGDSYWINNFSNEKNLVMNNKKISLSDEDKLYGVRPVIRLNKNKINISMGNGSKDNPYIVENDGEIEVGDYIKIDKDIWRVFDIDKKEIGLVKDKGLTSIRMFGNSDKFVINDKNSVGYYLNTSYLDSLSYKDKINNHKWMIGEYKDSYRDINSDSIKAKVGMISINDIKFNDLNGYYLINGNGEGEVYLYGSSNDTSKSNLARKIIPTIYVDKYKVNSGDGTKSNPYVLEGLE